MTFLQNEPWKQFAACKNSDMTDFFPVTVTKANSKQIAATFELCESCPVSSHCLKDAFEKESYGIWGRTTFAQRQDYIESRPNKNQPITLEECEKYIERITKAKYIPYTRSSIKILYSDI